MKLPTLFKAAKAGENVQWSIETNATSYIETYGRVGGKMQVHEHKAEPTNVGRANERNQKEQAEFEAKAKWQLKLDKGYREDQGEVDDVPLLPMLASKFKDRKGKFSYPVYLQPKLDGNRCIAKPDGSLISRGGKTYNVPHISKQIKALNLKYPIDGELYIHGESLQNIISYVKKDHGDGTTQKLNFVVYDVVIPGKAFPDRLKYILENVPKKFELEMEGKVAHLTTTTVNSEKAVLEQEAYLVKNGYEGAIVRTMDLMYESNHRSNNLMKVKSFQDDEFEVVGFKKADNGKVIWTCLTKGKDKASFDCYHKCTLAAGQELFKNAKSYVGKKLTVKYFKILISGKPEFPVGICFRNKEDLPNFYS